MNYKESQLVVKELQYGYFATLITSHGAVTMDEEISHKIGFIQSGYITPNCAQTV